MAPTQGSRAIGRYRNVISVLVVVYTLIAVVGNIAAPKGEFFPFFSWSLFSHVPDEWHGFELEITALDGAPLAAPVNYFELGEHFDYAARRSMHVVKLLPGIVYRGRQGGDNSRLVRRLEDVYLAAGPKASWCAGRSKP